MYEKAKDLFKEEPFWGFYPPKQKVLFTPAKCKSETKEFENIIKDELYFLQITHGNVNEPFASLQQHTHKLHDLKPSELAHLVFALIVVGNAVWAV